MKVSKSKIDDSWMVFIIESSDGNYDIHQNQFKEFGIAYAILDSKMIIIDGKAIEDQNLTQHHLLAIEAHEIGHYISDHKGLINKSLEEMEKEADWAAYQILNDLEKTKAASLIATRFEDAYEQNIKDYQIKPATRLKIEKFINETKVI